MEPVTIIRWATLFVVFIVFVIVAIAYYRTRLQRVLVLLLLDALVGLNVLVSVSDNFFEQGIPHFELLSAVLAFGIALLLLLTVTHRFE